MTHHGTSFVVPVTECRTGHNIVKKKNCFIIYLIPTAVSTFLCFAVTAFNGFFAIDQHAR